jgi:hypothetical protein
MRTKRIIGLSGVAAMAGLAVPIGIGIATANASPAATATATGTVAARPAECPTNHAFSACAYPIQNKTEGFAGPGETSVAKGFPFTFVEWNGSHGKDYAHSDVIAPGKSGYAFSTNRDGSLVPPDGNYIYTAGGVLAGKGVDADRIHLDASGDNHAWCVSGTYVHCTVGGQEGSSSDPFWSVTLQTRPLTVRIDNFLRHPLGREGGVVGANLVADPAGDRNLNMIPASADGVTGTAYYGGLLSVHDRAALTLSYRVLSGEFAGATIDIHLGIPVEGRPEDSTCQVHAPSGSGVLRCEIAESSVVRNAPVRDTVVIR